MEQGVAANPKPTLFDWWSKASASLRLGRHFVAVMFWSYVLTKLFIFDSDTYLFKLLAPDFAWILQYKFLIILSFLSVFFVVTRNVHIIFWTIYVIGYPILIASRGLWYLIAWIAGKKSWNVVLFAVNAAFGLFRAFKSYFVVLVGAAIAVAVILGSDFPPFLFGAAVGLLMLNGLLIWRTLRSVFSKTGVFLLHTKLTTAALGILKKPIEGDAGPKPVALDTLNETERPKFVERLGNAVLFHEGCKYWATVLQGYKWSGLNIVLYVASFLVLFFISVFLTAFEGLALHGADSTAFIVTSPPRFFDFFYFAFNAMLLQGNDHIVPSSDMARVFSMISALFTFSLTTLFLSLFLALKREIDDKSAENAIAVLEAQAADIDAYISQNFALSVDQAIVELEGLKSGTSGIIGWLKKARVNGPSVSDAIAADPSLEGVSPAIGK